MRDDQRDANGEAVYGYYQQLSLTTGVLFCVGEVRGLCATKHTPKIPPESQPGPGFPEIYKNKICIWSCGGEQVAATSDPNDREIRRLLLRFQNIQARVVQ